MDISKERKLSSSSSTLSAPGQQSTSSITNKNANYDNTVVDCDDGDDDVSQLKFNFHQISNLRDEIILNYDTINFDFNSEVKRILKLHWLHEFANFGSSHTLHLDANFFIDKNGNKINIMQHRWNKERSRDYFSSDYESFDLLYRRFIEEVVGPSLGGIK